MSGYYAVIFTSKRTALENARYETISQKMEELASAQPGYLGMESVRDENGLGITTSYWKTLEDVRAWKINSEHLMAQRLGKDKWYESYKVRICRVEREYGV